MELLNGSQEFQAPLTKNMYLLHQLFTAPIILDFTPLSYLNTTNLVFNHTFVVSNPKTLTDHDLILSADNGQIMEQVPGKKIISMRWIFLGQLLMFSRKKTGASSVFSCCRRNPHF